MLTRIRKLIAKSSRKIPPSLYYRGKLRKNYLPDPKVKYSTADLRRIKEDIKDWKTRLIRYYGPAGYPKRASIPMGSECPARVNFTEKELVTLRKHYKGSLFN